MMMIMKTQINKEKKNRKSKLGKKQQIKFFDYCCRHKYQDQIM
jgi:hypothetical protein